MLDKKKKFKNKKWFSTSKILVNKQLVLTTSSTKKILNLEIWAGNHPFFTNLKKDIDLDGKIKNFFIKTKL